MHQSISDVQKREYVMKWDENLEGPAKLIVESDDPLIFVKT